MPNTSSGGCRSHDRRTSWRGDGAASLGARGAHGSTDPGSTVTVCPICGLDLAPFFALSVLVTVVPGPDMALITRQVLLGGPWLARRTIAGNLSGLAVHGLALAAGLSALLMASATAYTFVKFAGAAYICFLGVQALRSARRRTLPDTGGRRPRPNSPDRAFVYGLMSTTLNPKPALFFLTVVPQFIDETRPPLPQIMLLVAIHVIVGLVWLNVYAELVQRASGVLKGERVKQWLEGLTGVVLLALGLRIATERA
jgi:threonine/homoserine/homoserine lactone efflux protein